jgi:putative transcriptional regulator
MAERSSHGKEASGGDNARRERLEEMLPTHHMHDEMLLAYAAGNLGEAESVLMATHLSLCPTCRARVLTAETVGGVLLDDIAPEPISGASLTAILDKLDVPQSTAPASPTSAIPEGSAVFPQPLRDYVVGGLDTLRWGWVQPGVKFAELLIDETGARMGLMRSKPGASITPHGHCGDELTLVLSGGYRDAGIGYRRGDVQAVDESVTHELVTDQDGECLSLVMIRGQIKPTRLIAKIVRHFTVF